MRGIIFRIVALVLAAVMLLGCISCDKTYETAEETESEYDKDQRFELIKVAPTYSEEFIERAAASFADVGERLLLLFKNVKVTDAQKISLKNYFKTDVFPIIVMAQIYAHEVDMLFEAMIDHLDNETDELASFEVLAGLYRVATDATDAERVGIVAYELSRIMISERAEESRSRYEKYGYSWYLDEAVAYETLNGELTETLGRDKFIRASNIAFFIMSVAYGIGMPENELGLSVNERETLLILEMQADFFCEAELGEEDWKIFAGVLTELVPENNATYMNSELYALKKNGYFVSLAEVMPSVLALYEAATDSLSAGDGTALGEDGSLDARAIVGALLSDDAALLACLDKLEASGASNTKAEADAVASLKLTAEYNSFIEGRRAMTRDEFVESLRVLAASETPVAAQTLYELIWNYTVGIAPYIAFAVHYQK